MLGRYRVGVAKTKDDGTQLPRRRAVLMAGVATAALAACTDNSEDAPAKAAGLVASGLTTGRFAGGPVTGAGADKEYTALVKGLGASSHTVRVKKVAPGPSKTTRILTLSTQWVLSGGRRWSYDHAVTLRSAKEKWSLPWSPALVHPALRTGERLSAANVAQDRADITDANGAPIVTPRPVYRVGIDKTKAPGATSVTSAGQLATIVGVDAAMFARSVAASGPSGFVEAIVLRTEAVPAAQAAKIRAIPGAVLLPDRRALAPSAGFARAVLGTVSPATAEIVAKSKGTVTGSDVVGVGGLQQQYDAQLRGVAALKISAVLPGAAGPQSTRTLASLGGTAAKPLRTSLRQDLQTSAEALLKAQKGPSALVAIRPSTGEILVAASGAGSNGYNTAFLGRYAPGSTFKVVSSLALLRSGLKVTDPVQCTPTISVQGRTVTNFPDYPADKLGTIPFKTAIANSCNTVLIRGADRASQVSLAVAAESLGLTQNQADGPFFGSVSPDDAGAEHQVAMIGQGKVLASPLGMATVAASVAKSARVTPYLLPDHKPPAVKAPATALTPAEAASLRELMRAVVTEGGATAIKSLPGAPVLAKTGTAEYGTGPSPKTHSWMIAIQGDIAVSVFVETGGYGGVTCLPIVKSFLTAVAQA